MTTGHPADPLVRRESEVTPGCVEIPRIPPAALLAAMIERVLTTPAARLADVVNDALRLGENAASALLDAGDVQAWELTTRVAGEITALAGIRGVDSGPRWA